LKLDTEKNIDRGIRAVAVFEAAKGSVVLLAGFGLLALLHRDLQVIAERLVELSHLNPAHHYPTIFIEAMSKMNDSRIMAFAAFAGIYAAVRFVEAYGLWRLRAWAEWFAIVSGSIYVPIEIYEVARHVTWLRVTVLIVNLAIVAYLVYVRVWMRKHPYHESKPEIEND
jgi:uncharacterized membrane protein (DUF2068 family)